MGMTAGKRDGLASDLNIVPLIDVLLVLIIIFMVISPQVATGLAAFIPQPPSQTPSPPPLTDPHTIVVQVLQDGKLLINQDQVAWDQLGTRLAHVFSQRAQKVAFVLGADDVPFDEVARAVDIMRAAGIDHVGLLTTQLSEESAPQSR